jgi:hypothetical protein
MRYNILVSTPCDKALLEESAILEQFAKEGGEGE